MASFSELPVYKVGYDLLLQIYKRSSQFSREYRYTLGERLKSEVTDMLICIYKANKSKSANRLSYIEEARRHVEVVRLLLRVCKDLKIIGLKGHVSLNVNVEEVSKQLTAWQRHVAGACARDEYVSRGTGSAACSS